MHPFIIAARFSAFLGNWRLSSAPFAYLFVLSMAVSGSSPLREFHRQTRTLSNGRRAGYLSCLSISLRLPLLLPAFAYHTSGYRFLHLLCLGIAR
ncbi:hypothetical protein NDU88_004928 [Pleurodeles waltl]|uniref:Uncharacterized protein n=1 Tax=Pleurodeles waltl TaxID=8319 RepID=A0AAV7VLB5_PLEWA|nr:hypothetical protein NDU88_004928 [Pleurodeles waltl]